MDWRGGWWPGDAEQILALLSLITGTAAVVGIALGLFKGFQRLWARTVGARRNQRQLIASLFLGANMEYVKDVLGPGALVTRSASTDAVVHRYRLLDCWLSVGEGRGAVEWISITVTDPKFVFRTKNFTMDLIDVRLGRDCFDRASHWFDGTGVASLGQKEQSYLEICDGPTAHRSQKAILGYTNAGVGGIATNGVDLGSPTVVREQTTINSLSIARPFAELPDDSILGSQEVQAVPPGEKAAFCSSSPRSAS